MNSQYRKNYAEWLNSSIVDVKTKEELRALSANDDELRERFGKMLKFGTSGLRGLMRAGLNGMNVYTVRYATQGLAALVNRMDRANDGVVIAYDSRNNSRKFAECAAEVLAANGIKVYFFDSLRPTPELSFAVRTMSAVAGVNITASHNPKEYNGYKVYWDDGAQIAPDKANEIAAWIDRLHIFDDVKVMSFNKAVESGIVEVGGKEVDELYIREVLSQSLAGDFVHRTSDEVRIVYAPFHGAGYRYVPKILEAIGIKNLILVKEQMLMDGNFPTVPTPNPEFACNYELANSYAEEASADIIIGTDPDSDRCGCAVKTDSGYQVLTGNQMGVLILDYVLTRKAELGTLPSNGAVCKSVVSTSLADAICEKFSVSCVNTLSGFKYIGEKIKEFEANGEHEFVFGFEESIGFLTGTYTRDKDAVLAAMLIAEITCFYKDKGMTVYEGLQSVYERYGYSAEHCDRVSFEGYDALGRMTDVMTHIRSHIEECANEICESSGLDVIKVRDFLHGIDGFNPTDMLYFELADNCTAIMRPSGTEPVLKIYVHTTGGNIEIANRRGEILLEACKDIVNNN